MFAKCLRAFPYQSITETPYLCTDFQQPAHMNTRNEIKRNFWAGFFFAAVISLFFGYLIGATAVVIVAALQAFLAVTLSDTPGEDAAKGFGLISAGALTAVGISMAVSYLWALLAVT